MQSNVQEGDIVLLANEDLQGKEDYLVKIVNDSGTAKFALPDAITDYALFLVTDGGDEDELTYARPLEPGRNVRLKMEGTCNPGDVLVLAAIAGSDAGMVRALPSSAGTYRGLAIAEEIAVDGQLVKARPALIGNITVSG